MSGELVDVVQHYIFHTEVRAYFHYRPCDFVFQLGIDNEHYASAGITVASLGE